MNTDPNSITPDFKKAQQLATQLLLRQNIDSLKIDVRSFKFDKRVCIDSIQHYSQVTHIPIEQDRKSTRLNSSHSRASRMPSSA